MAENLCKFASVKKWSQAERERLARGVAELESAGHPHFKPVVGVEGVMLDAQYVEDGPGSASHGDLRYIELPYFAAQVDEHGDGSSRGQAKAGEGVDAVAESAGTA